LATFSALVVGFLSYMVMRTHQLPVRTGVEGLASEVATARTPLSPRGKVFVHGEIWDAVLEAGDRAVAAGEPVEVVNMQDLTLTVRPLRPAVTISATPATPATSAASAISPTLPTSAA
jgi:membrane-bound serine protease (ClpP class)